jgi:hypothetical protein
MSKHLKIGKYLERFAFCISLMTGSHAKNTFDSASRRVNEPATEKFLKKMNLLVSVGQKKAHN